MYPNHTQMKMFEAMFSAKRYVWNHFLAMNMKRFESKEGILSYKEMSSLLTTLKQENKWLYACEKSALQNTLKALTKAYDRFFKGSMRYSKKTIEHAKRTGKRLTCYHLEGHPKFKSYKNHKQSLVMNLTNNNIEVLEKEWTFTSSGKPKKQNCKIKLPKVKLIKISYSRPYEGRIQNVTVVRESDGKYYVSICCTDVLIKEIPLTHAHVGIDLGVKVFATLSDGKIKSNPKYYTRNEKKLIKLQRSLSRCEPGSKNYHKARQKLSRWHKVISNSRLDFLHKYTTELIKSYDVICIEDLKPKEMLKDSNYSKSISDASYHIFRLLLTYKIDVQEGKQLLIVDQYYPSSQLCHVCDYQNPEVKDVSIRKWQCPNCQVVHDRDMNASKNILREGLRQIA